MKFPEDDVLWVTEDHSQAPIQSACRQWYAKGQNDRCPGFLVSTTRILAGYHSSTDDLAISLLEPKYGVLSNLSTFAKHNRPRHQKTLCPFGILL
jgi:hypothetical protein